MFAEPPPLRAAPPAPRPPDRIWRGKDVPVGFALLIASFLLVSLSLVGIDQLVELDDREIELVGFGVTILWEASFAAIVLFLALRRGATLRALGFRKPDRWGPLPILVVACYGSLLGYGLLIEYLKQLGIDVSWIEGTNQVEISEDGSDFPLALVLVVVGLAVMVAAPLAEELFFRGLVYRALGEIWPALPAFLLSGFLFGAFHLNPGVLIPFTLIGMLLAWGFRASGSIWVPITTHFIINAVSFTVTVYGVLD